MYRLLPLLLLLSCEKWPHQVDCFCLVGTRVFNTSDKKLCDEKQGEIVQCNIHDLIKYNEQRNNQRKK
jgi:hypothetical protein